MFLKFLSVVNLWKIKRSVMYIQEIHTWLLLCPVSKRESLQDNVTLKKGKFIADSSQGSCRIQRSGGGSESPEPKLLHKFIGWA